MKSLLIALAGVAASTAVATAQSAPRPAAGTHQAPATSKNELASTRWFIDAVAKKDLEDEDLWDFRELEMTLHFRPDGQAHLVSPSLPFQPAPAEIKRERGASHVNMTVSNPEHGEASCKAVIRQNQLEGILVWQRKAGEPIEYTILGRRATPLDGTAWTVRVTPQPVGEEEEVDEPSSETIEFERGTVRVRETEDSQLYLDPIPYQLTTTDTKLVISTGPASKGADGVVWRLEINAEQLSGTLTQVSDGEMTSKYGIQGRKVESPPGAAARKGAAKRDDG